MDGVKMPTGILGMAEGMPPSMPSGIIPGLAPADDVPVLAGPGKARKHHGTCKWFSVEKARGVCADVVAPCQCCPGALRTPHPPCKVHFPDLA